MTNRKLSKRQNKLDDYDAMVTETDYMLKGHGNLLLREEHILYGVKKIKEKTIQDFLDRLDKEFGNDIAD